MLSHFFPCQGELVIHPDNLPGCQLHRRWNLLKAIDPVYIDRVAYIPFKEAISFLASARTPEAPAALSLLSQQIHTHCRTLSEALPALEAMLLASSNLAASAGRMTTPQGASATPTKKTQPTPAAVDFLALSVALEDIKTQLQPALAALAALKALPLPAPVPAPMAPVPPETAPLPSIAPLPIVAPQKVRKPRTSKKQAPQPTAAPESSLPPEPTAWPVQTTQPMQTTQPVALTSVPEPTLAPVQTTQPEPAPSAAPIQTSQPESMQTAQPTPTATPEPTAAPVPVHHEAPQQYQKPSPKYREGRFVIPQFEPVFGSTQRDRILNIPDGYDFLVCYPFSSQLPNDPVNSEAEAKEMAALSECDEWVMVDRKGRVCAFSGSHNPICFTLDTE